MKIGAAWTRSTDKGLEYLSCVIESPGMSLNFAMFLNTEKKSEKEPDYNIIWSPKKENSSSPKPISGNKQNTEGNPGSFDQQHPVTDDEGPF